MSETATASEDAPGPEKPEGQTAVPPPSKRRRRWYRLPIAILLQILLVLLLVLFWVLGTQSGLRFSLSMVDEFKPGLLQVEQADGRVLGDLHLEGLKVRAPGLDVDLGSFDLRWSPLAVFTGTLRIAEISVRDLDVVAAPSEEPEEEKGAIELPQIALPLELELEQLLVERFSIGAPGDTPPFRVDRIALAASWQGSEVTLKQLSVALPKPLVNANAKGAAELIDDYPLSIDLDWDLSQEPALTLAGKGKVSGDLRRLRVEHDLTGSAQVRLDVLLQEVLDHPRWEGKLEIRGIDLPSLAADLPSVDLTGELATKGDLDDARVQGNLAGEAPDLPDFGSLKVALDLTWRQKVLDIVTLELTEDESGALLTADGQLDLGAPDGRFNIEAAWEKLRWPLTGELIAEARQGKIDAGGTFKAFNYEVAAEVWGRDFPEAVLNLTGDGDQESTRIHGLRVETLEGKIEAHGRVAWAPELGWELNLTADEINPGAQWEALPALIGAELSSAGDLNAFEYKLDAGVTSEVLPTSTLVLQGEGDIKGTRVENLRLETLGGYLTAKADLAWDKIVTWNAELDLADIDPGKQWPEWGGLLGGRILSAGSLEDGGPDLSADLESLKGKLRGYPVDAAGSLTMQGAEIQIPEFRLASGPSNLRVAGSVGEQLDLEIGLSSPDLESLLPGATGSVKASGTVSGTLGTPAIKLGLAAKGVKVAGNGIKDLSGSADVDLGKGGLMKIDLKGGGLVAGGMAFDSVGVQADGDMGSHRLSAKLQGEPLVLDLAAAGGLNEDNAYSGQLEQLNLQTQELGSWRLQKAAPIALAGARVSAGPVCIREETGSGGCVGFEQTETGTWNATLDLDRLAFDLFKAFIPEGLVLEGEALAKADFKASGGVLTGNARLQVPKGVLSAAASGGGEQLELLNFSSANLGVDAGGRGLQGKLALPLTGLGDLSGEFSLPGWSLADPARPEQSLRGGFKARVDDLGVVSRFVPDITNLTGNLGADFKLGGTISKPGVSGSARLANGGLDVPLIGLKIADLTLNADARNLDRIDYSGGFTAGNGRLEIDGQTLLATDGPLTSVTAKGERLTLANSKEYFLLASVDVEAKVAPTGTRVTGTVTIPEARIRPRTIPAGSVSPSSDVIIATEASDEQSRYATELDLHLVLGKAVTVNAFGLEGSLEGELAVLQQSGKEILGDGELKIVDGTYRISTGGGLSAAVGKPLDIEQGFLNYAKSPIGNPFLVLTAQREDGDVTAGIRVFGTVKNPKLTFFSATDPGMSQSEVTTYLLTGIPPKRSGSSDDSGLSLGTYVAPKLFAEYESSLGDEADKIKLRYDLNDWIELQTETGDSQGGDVFFKIEK